MVPYSQAIWQLTGYLKLLKYSRLWNLKAREGECMATYIWSHRWLRNNSGDFSVMLLLSIYFIFIPELWLKEYVWAICLQKHSGVFRKQVLGAGRFPKESSTRLVPHWACSDPTWPPPECLISLLNGMLWSPYVVLNCEIPKAELYPMYSVGASSQAFLRSFFHKTRGGFLTRSANQDLQCYWYINVKCGLWLRREIFSSETSWKQLDNYQISSP